MRIISVKFLNLNSLKEEQEIRFDKPPFTESGLFAITGPTGAGKTTILDAITVALYGRVHRHNKDASETMSRHTAECYSEVEFEVKSKIYRAKWSLRRSRGKVNGALQGYKMELAEVSTGILLGGHTLTSVQQAIVELCGLDYNQFLRSVILSQGDFTKFLKADENERSDLLEKITDTGIYSDISKFIFERAKEEREKLDALRSKLNDVELLSTEDEKLHEQHLVELSKDEKVFKEKHGLVVSKITWLTNLQVLELKKNQFALQLSEQHQLQEEKQSDFTRLMFHRQAMEYKPALAEIKALQDHADQLKVDLERLNLQLPLVKEDNENARNYLEKTKIEEAKGQRELSDAKPLLEKVIKLDSEIESLTVQVSRLNLLYSQTSTDVKSLVQKEEERTKDLEKVELRSGELQVWLTENNEDGTLDNQLIIFKQYNKELHELSKAIESCKGEQDRYHKQEAEDKALLVANDQAIELLNKEIGRIEFESGELTTRLETDFSENSLEDLELEASKLPSLINYCEQQLKSSKAFFQYQQNKKELINEISNQKDSYQQQLKALKFLEGKKVAAESNLSDLRQLVELQQRIQKYETDRRQLQPNHPCPLCGSIHHPYVLEHYNGELTEAERKRNDQEIFVRKLTDDFNQKSIDVNTLKLTIQSKEEQIVKLEAVLLQTLQEFNHINSLLPKGLDIEKAETINNIILKKRQQYEGLQKDVKELRGIKQKQSENQSFLSEKRGLLILAESKSGATIARIETFKEQADRVSKLNEEHQGKQTQVLSNIAALLSPFHIEFDYHHAPKIELALIERAEKFARTGKELQQLSLEKTRIETEIKSIGESLEDKLSLMLKQEAELRQETEKQQKLESERSALFGNKNPSQEWEQLNGKVKEYRELSEKAQLFLQQKQEQLRVDESRLAQLTIDLENSLQKLSLLTKQLTIDIQDKGILTIEALKKLFLQESEVQQIAAIEKDIETRIAALIQLISTAEADLKKEIAKSLTTQTIEELKPKLDELDLATSTLNQEIGRIRQILEEDSRLKLRFAEVAKDIEVQQKEYSRWYKLSSLIGSADGKKFSRFAQGLTLARLTELANRHLLKLSDRYQILKSKEKDLELQIIDGYQADVIRPMATLSGGESFLVSLALALGLSDLASKKVQINSLFIDEGFGTLDAETLDVAISALENLQAKGKSIGIISHVDALKERIGTQIQVSKQPGGSSKIKLLSYSKEFLETEEH